jgi:hypothetical protein
VARTYRSAVIHAPIETVWDKVRDFNGLPIWHPAIASSEIEEDRSSDSVGCVRKFRLQDGALLRERLLALSDLEHTFTYSILVSPMPVKNYVATFKLTRITVGDDTLAEWWADFDVTSGTDEEMITFVGDGVFVAGFKTLDERLKR